MKNKVLFVDDDTNILEGFKRAFRKEEFEIIIADSAGAGMEVLRNNEIALVVSDQNMPETTGTEFLSIVKSNYPDTIRIMLTGETDMETPVNAINDGEIFRFFIKPFNQSQLGFSIRQGLQQYELVYQSRIMLDTMRQQSSYLSALTEEYPDILRGNTEYSPPAVVGPVDLANLLEELKAETKKASKYLKGT